MSFNFLRFIACPAIVCLALAASSTEAATPLPDAGQLLKEQAPREPDFRAMRPVAVQAAPEAPPTDLGTGTLHVEGFTITGLDRPAGPDVQALLGSYAKREVRVEELAELARRLTQALRDSGLLLARAFVPPQEVKGGIVSISVQAGRVGSVVVRNESGIADHVVRRYGVRLAASGALSEADVERTLLLLRDLPGVDVQLLLRPGAIAGTTDVELLVREANEPSASVTVQNTNNALTGRASIGVSAGVAGLFGQGETWSAAFSRSRHMTHSTLGGRWPLGSDGVRLTLTRSGVAYDGLDGEFAAAGLRGEASSVQAALFFPLVLRRDRTLELSVSGERKSLRDELRSVSDVRSRRLASLGADVLGEWSQPGSAGLRVAGSLSYRDGRRHLDVDSSAPGVVDDPAVRSGRYRIVTASVRVQTAMSREWQLSARVDGQTGSTGLDSAQKFSLGGPYAVRGYAASAASGRSGTSASIEARRAGWPLAGMSLLAFVDAGAVSDPSVSDGRNRLTSWGVGAAGTASPKTSWTVTLAKAGPGSGPAWAAARSSGARAWAGMTHSF